MYLVKASDEIRGPKTTSHLVHGTGLVSLKLRHWLNLDQIFFNNSMHSFRTIPYKGPAEY